LYLLNTYADINIPLLFYCIAVLFFWRATQDGLCSIKIENFYFSIQFKWRNFLRIPSSQDITYLNKIIDICVTVSARGFTDTHNCCYNWNGEGFLTQYWCINLYFLIYVIRKRKYPILRFKPLMNSQSAVNGSNLS